MMQTKTMVKLATPFSSQDSIGGSTSYTGFSSVQSQKLPLWNLQEPNGDENDILLDALKTRGLCVGILSRVTVNTSKPKDTWEGEKMADEDRDLIEILEEHNPVDMAKYINYVSALQAGAIATFSGTTRDTFEGKTVLELRYEAYVPMAVRCIKSACQSARSSWNLMSIAVAHRLGPVPVGETSVFIAVSSVHRDDALDACKFLIDEIKASVPIWKKEVYTNGEVWKENKEFLERKSELEKGARDEYRCCRKKLESKPNGHGCCGAKVKIDDDCNGERGEAE